jgi:hypothetical protein
MVVFLRGGGKGDYVIVNFSLNCVYSCCKWCNVHICLYLHAILLSLSYVYYDVLVVENIWCIVLSGCTIQKYCYEVVFAHVANFSSVLVGQVSSFYCMFSPCGFSFIACGGIYCRWFRCLLFVT